jgi:hypothetical protein
MRLKIGLIAENKQIVDRIKAEFDDVHIYYASNIMDFYKVIGTNKTDALIFCGEAKLPEEFSSYYNYIRQKPAFKSTPIAVFTSCPMVNKHVLEDPLVRYHHLDGGFFIPLMGLMEAMQGNRNLQNIFSNEAIEVGLKKALDAALGQDADFKARVATDDEAHSEFLAQATDEISCNLLWIKYAARLLNVGSEIFVKSSGMVTEEQMGNHSRQVLLETFEKFAEAILKALKEEGALFFTKSDTLPGPEKVPFIKKAKSHTVLFESHVCRVLVEFIRYI